MCSRNLDRPTTAPARSASAATCQHRIIIARSAATPALHAATAGAVNAPLLLRIAAPNCCSELACRGRKDGRNGGGGGGGGGGVGGEEVGVHHCLLLHHPEQVLRALQPVPDRAGHVLQLGELRFDAVQRRPPVALQLLPVLRKLLVAMLHAMVRLPTACHTHTHTHTGCCHAAAVWIGRSAVRHPRSRERTSGVGLVPIAITWRVRSERWLPLRIRPALEAQRAGRARQRTV